MWNRYSSSPVEITKYAGIADLLGVWKLLDIEVLLEEVGIAKRSGVEAWKAVLCCTLSPILGASSLLEAWRAGMEDSYVRSLLSGLSHYAITRLLSNRSYDWKRFNLLRIEEMQAFGRLRCSQEGWIFLDDGVIEKSGKAMEGISYVFDPVKRKPVLGYMLVSLIYWDCSKEYPLSFELKLKSRDRISIAIELVEELAAIIQTRNIAFDSWYFSLKLLKKLRGLGFTWLTKAKRNRIFVVNGRKRKAKALIKQGYCGLAELPGYGTVKIATVKAAKRKQLLVTNKLDMPKKEMKLYYSKRFRIDNPFHKEMKQSLNLESFHTRSLSSIIAHIAISFLARSLLGLIRVFSRKAKGKSMAFIIKLINTLAVVMRMAGRMFLQLILLPRKIFSKLR